jgi:hypothetical protein
MTKKDRETIALDFIALHKKDDVADWLLQAKDLSTVYVNLIMGSFGNVHSDADGGCTVEISQYDSKSGHTELYDFELSGDDWKEFKGIDENTGAME